MHRFFCPWLLTLLIAVILAGPLVAQVSNQPALTSSALWAQGSGGASERSAPAPQYTVAALATALVLVIVCMPSRKR